MYIGAIRKDLLSAPLHVLDKRGYRQILTSKEWLDNITIEFMFAGINMFWARLRLILARAATRGLK